jgi:hypothetical protein
MRLSDAGLRRHEAKLIYPNHRPPPWLTEDATRDRSNRLLDGYADVSKYAHYFGRSRAFSARVGLNRGALKYSAPTAIRTIPTAPEGQTAVPRVPPLTRLTNPLRIIDAPARIQNAPNKRFTKMNARPNLPMRFIYRLTIRLSDAGMRCRQTKLIYPHHRSLLGSPKTRPAIARTDC